MTSSINDPADDSQGDAYRRALDQPLQVADPDNSTLAVTATPINEDLAPVEQTTAIALANPTAIAEVETVVEATLDPDPMDSGDAISDDEIIDDVEMSLFEHLEELRNRLLYSVAAVFVAIVGCFLIVNKIVYLLEIPAKGAKFLQLGPGEYFYVSLKVAGYSGLLVASPIILYHIVRFVLPGLTKKEKRLIIPIMFGSSILFFAGLGFAYIALIPAALNFFVNYGGDVVEQLWSIDRYFEFVLLLLFSTGLAFQVPVIQVLLALVGIVSSQRMLSTWRYVILGAVILGAVLTPSTDPITQTLLASAVGGLYFGGIAIVKLLGR